MSKQSFEEAFPEHHRVIEGDNTYCGTSKLPQAVGALEAWDHQQKTIDSQAEKIKELEYDIALILGHANVADREYFEKENEELESQNKILRERVEFYANKNNWLTHSEARKALAQLKEEKVLEVV